MFEGIDPRSPTPIYEQIAARVRELAPLAVTPVPLVESGPSPDEPRHEPPAAITPPPPALTRTCLPNASRLFNMITGLSLKRKLLTASSL